MHRITYRKLFKTFSTALERRRPLMHFPFYHVHSRRETRVKEGVINHPVLLLLKHFYPLTPDNMTLHINRLPKGFNSPNTVVSYSRSL